MALYEVKERIRKRKKRRRKRLLIFMGVLMMIGLAITLFTTSLLEIKQVVITGNQKIPSSVLEKEAEQLMGENLLLLSKQEALSLLKNHAYFSTAKIKRKFPDVISIEITEKEAEISYVFQGVVNLLTKEGILLESGANLLEGGLLLRDLQNLPDLGENIYEENEAKQLCLAEFRTLQIRNLSELKFSELDLTDMANLKTYYKDLEIWLGYPEGLKEKLNAAINIITEGNLHETTGYVDVSYLEYPVVYDEAVMSPQEGIETPQEGIETPGA